MGDTPRTSAAGGMPRHATRHSASDHLPSSEPASRAAIVVLLELPARQAEVAHLCRVIRGAVTRSVVASGSGLVVCDVGAIEHPDASIVDALCRLQLESRRAGGGLQVRHANRALRELLQLTGLDGVVPVEERLHLEPRRQSEHREEARRVQEKHDPGDPIA
jgi:anti-anti-sigma regulatory factor